MFEGLNHWVVDSTRDVADAFHRRIGIVAVAWHTENRPAALRGI